MKLFEFMNGFERLAKQQPGSHELGAVLAEAELDAWQKLNPDVKLPADHLALLRRHNGIAYQVDEFHGGWIHFLPLSEVVSMVKDNPILRLVWGKPEDWPKFPSSWYCIATDGDGQRIVCLDVETGEYKDVAPIGAPGPDLNMDGMETMLTWVVNAYEIEFPEPEKRKRPSGGGSKPAKLEQAFVLTGHLGIPQYLAVVPGSGELVSASDDEWRYAPPMTVEEWQKFPCPAVRFWSLTERRELQAPWPRLASARQISISARGDRMCLLTERKQVAYNPTGLEVYDLNTRELIAARDIEKGKEDEASGTAFRVARIMPGGKHVLTAYWDSTMRLWNLDTKADDATLRGHALFKMKVTNRAGSYYWGALFQALAISDDGRYAASSAGEKELLLWDLVKAQPLDRLAKQRFSVQKMVFSPAGDVLAIANETEKIVYLLDIESGNVLQELRGHTKPFIRGIAFFPDGKRVVSGGWDAAVRVWETETGRETNVGLAYRAGKVGEKNHLVPVRAVTISGDGKLILGATDDRQIVAWHVPS